MAVGGRSLGLGLLLVLNQLIKGTLQGWGGSNIHSLVVRDYHVEDPDGAISGAPCMAVGGRSLGLGLLVLNQLIKGAPQSLLHPSHGSLSKGQAWLDHHTKMWLEDHLSMRSRCFWLLHVVVSQVVQV
jgi:hypothetical protein